MPTVETEVSVDFDLCDYEDDIEKEYCDGNCLKDKLYTIKDDLKEYLHDMEMNLYFYSEKHRKFKSYEEIYRDLKAILEEN